MGAMSRHEMIKRLDEVRDVAERSVAFDPVHVQALDRAINQLDDRPALAVSAAALVVAALAMIRR